MSIASDRDQSLVHSEGSLDPQSEARSAQEEESQAQARAEAEELESLQDAALSIPDSDTATLSSASIASSDITSPPLPSSAGHVVLQHHQQQGQDDAAVMLSNPGTVLQARPTTDWSTVLGYSSQGLGAATAASSTGFAFARGATAFGLNLAKRITQGLVAIPAMAVDGAVTGTVAGNSDNTPSLAKLAHMTVGGFFDAISLVALGGIDVTSALTGAGLGTAGSGVEGLRRTLGSEVLRSLSEFSKLVKREWNADDDALPPGGIPAYSIIGITQALSTWVCIQLVTREYQERRMLKSLVEVDLDRMEQELKEAHEREERDHGVSAALMSSDAGQVAASSSALSPSGSSGARESVRITSKEVIAIEEGRIIGAEIGSKQSEGSSPFAVPRSSAARPLTDLEALRGLQRYSKLVLGVYGGLALAWLGTLPSTEQAAAAAADGNGSAGTSSTIFSAEEEFLSRDQAEFLEAAAQMDLPEETDSIAEGRDSSGTFPGAYAASVTSPGTPPRVASAQTSTSTPAVQGQDRSTLPPGAAYSYLDILSGTHDNDLFHRTANLESGSAQEGSYDEQKPREYPDGKARPSKPRFYVVTDHPRRAVILVLRGSLSLGDFAADLTCESVPFSFHPSVLAASEPAQPESQPAREQARFVSDESEDYCHEGMLITAKEIGDVDRPVNRAVASALRANEGYSLEIAGHSLGAGVASILAMMWGDPSTGLTIAASGLPIGRRVHAYCYAVPCVATESLARKCAALVTSHVYSYDLVTRLSLGAIQDIRNGCAWLCYEDAEASKRSNSEQQQAHGRGGGQGAQKMSTLMRKAFQHQAGRLDSTDPENDDKAQLEADFLSLRKTLEANMGGTHLFPPGKVLYSLPSTDLNGFDGADLSPARVDLDRLFTVDSKPGSLKNVFGQIIFSRSMLSCHMPHVYDRAMQRLPHLQVEKGGAVTAAPVVEARREGVQEAGVDGTR